MDVLVFDKVVKTYHRGARYLPSFRDWVLKLSGKSKINSERAIILNKISFKVEKGEVLGFLGPNGVGKSTILKLISKVTYPDSGNIIRKGSIAGLLELRAGFHPELTGAENIIFNGMILGLSRTQITSRYQDIVNFAGIDDFLNTPVKHYSSGMMARLGFSIAVFVQPDILLVDEVLAVGDEEFQRKCMKKMNQFCKDKSHTMVFISHDLKALESLCTRIIYLDQGKIIADGKPKQVIRKYLVDQGLEK